MRQRIILILIICVLANVTFPEDVDVVIATVIIASAFWTPNYLREDS